MINKLPRKQSKIIILGATGFIGKNIALYFSKKFKIKATYNKKAPFLNKNIEWVKCNLKNAKQINNLFDNIDIVINAAATTSGAKDIIDKPHIHVNDNALMNVNILEVIKLNIIFFLVAPLCIKVVLENKMKKNLTIK